MGHKNPTREEFLEWYKVIYLENDLELFKKTHEYYSNENNQGMPKFKYKYFTKTEGSTMRYYYDSFMYVTNLIYKIYLKVKDAKTFEELIQKMYLIKLSEVNDHVEKELDRKYFEKNQLKKDEFSTLDLFLISNWLNLKPNKEFKPLLNKCKKLLESTKFTGQFN